ncbi:methyltransferase domain-containing protein [Altererythrobacter confluentis]|uniref:Methyltransferase domain-containing protein n=1 Tax=Allopontixanthobacter confluentis TaxID=1849021 RepID=A0A6L7GD66_9SPHN|nr:class I SAM-dependent methyltransferase [Allopontixanthobacter confluentis]MXP13416.1 methyltransferase domain-containing protein [Allopontixanthobacter confluentis]
MNKPDEAAAWGDFWAAELKSTAGCLPSGYLGIDAAQAKKWLEFAKTLPAKSRLLDLATGDARVMRWILQARKDVKPTGIDRAPQLPIPPKGTKVRAGVSMEMLPFRDSAFSAVTSQFGFEYGDTSKISTEIARVLRPDGRVAILTHRQDGPILAHNLERLKQLSWVLDDQNLIELAKRSLSLRVAGISAIPAKISLAPEEGARLFGATSAAWEIAEAVRQSITLGQRDTVANVRQLLDQIAAKAANERGRIASLQIACARTADSDGFLREISDGGLTQLSIQPVAEAKSIPPFADWRILARTN